MHSVIFHQGIAKNLLFKKCNSKNTMRFFWFFFCAGFAHEVPFLLLLWTSLNSVCRGVFVLPPSITSIFRLLSPSFMEAALLAHTNRYDKLTPTEHFLQTPRLLRGGWPFSQNGKPPPQLCYFHSFYNSHKVFNSVLVIRGLSWSLYSSLFKFKFKSPFLLHSQQLSQNLAQHLVFWMAK